MDKDRETAKIEYKELSRKEKVKHFWYYYKVHCIIALGVILLLGFFVYQKATEVKYDTSVMIFARGYISQDGKNKINTKFSKWIDGNCETTFISIVEPDMQNAEKVSAVYSKLDSYLAAGITNAFIFDKETYDAIMENAEYKEVLNDNTVKIGVAGIKSLGLDSRYEYYYVTRKVYKSEENDEDAINAHDTSLKIFEKIEEMN